MKECCVGDSVLIEVPEQKIKEMLKLDRNSLVLITEGKNSGKISSVEDINEGIMKCRSNDESFETLKSYAFVIGKEKPLIRVA
jgi:small subunit ribosomal protein S4e